jgi:hypothetical protein
MTGAEVSSRTLFPPKMADVTRLIRLAYDPLWVDRKAAHPSGRSRPPTPKNPRLWALTWDVPASPHGVTADLARINRS